MQDQGPEGLRTEAVGDLGDRGVDVLPSLVEAPEVAQCGGQLETAPVPPRLPQPDGQRLEIERHREGLITAAVVGAGILVGHPGITG